MRVRDDTTWEETIRQLLEEEEYSGHPLRESLAALFQQYQDNLNQIERLTSISDGYQSAMRERNETITERYRKQMRQLKKIVRISDHYQQMLHESNQSLKAASTRDHLTGLANRLLMLERLKAEAAHAKRRQTPFSVALLDVDHFKQINDAFGHDVGDATLIAIACALQEALRPYDLCARWGGEEFLILLPETPQTTAVEIAKRLCKIVGSAEYPGLPDEAKPSISIGIAEHALDHQPDETIKRADRAMYQAKGSGRNCVIAAND